MACVSDNFNNRPRCFVAHFFSGVKNSDRKKNPIDSDKISEEIFPS